MDELVKALDYLNPDNYEEWLQVGMALKHDGYSVNIWDSWSRGSAKYKAREIDSKWNSFQERNASSPVTVATIYKKAYERGYSSEAQSSGVFGWDDEISFVGRDYKIIDSGFVSEEEIPPVSKTYDGAAELREYLSELFEPDEHVGYCDRLENIDGRYVPKRGIKRRTAGEITTALKKGFDAASICGKSVGGALIRFNPLDGTGESDANVTRFNYCLLESDTMSLGKQLAMIKSLNLPAKFVVYSGGKSLHVICHVDAENLQQYRSRVNTIYEFCEKNGYILDKNDKNASRYSRMPGAKRGDVYQRIIERNIGAKSYKEWLSWVETQNDNLPKDISLADWITSPPPKKEELIEGLVQLGDKMIISGTSKSGKSFLLMELAAAIADGTTWLGFPVKQGRVVYVNLELQDSNCYERFEALDIQHPGNIQVWNLRGRTVPMDKLTAPLINRFKDTGVIAVIIDPIYKVITGDENNASEMSEFCAYFERAANEIGATMIYCHHHSKGATAKYANAVDRASGSGVFARDPDAIIDMTELSVSDVEQKYRKQVPGDCPVTAWEMVFSLRCFKPQEPIRIWFDFPRHYIDEWNFLAEAKYMNAGGRGVSKGQTEKESWSDMIQEVLNLADGVCERESLKEQLGISDSNLNKNIGTKSLFEAITLAGDGERLIIFRDVNEVVYKGRKYIRPMANTNGGRKPKWLPK